MISKATESTQFYKKDICCKSDDDNDGESEADGYFVTRICWACDGDGDIADPNDPLQVIDCPVCNSSFIPRGIETGLFADDAPGSTGSNTNKQLSPLSC